MCSIAKIWKQWKRKSKLQFFLNYNFLHLPNVFWIYLEIVRTYFSSRIRVFTEGIPVAHNGVCTFANTHRRYNVSSLNITILKITNGLNNLSMNINNNFLYFGVSDFRTYGSLENTTAGGTPYPHSSFGARSRPSPSRARLVSQCIRAHWLYYDNILYYRMPFIFINIDCSKL